MKISIVVISKDEPALGDTLDALAMQTRGSGAAADAADREFEVIVVDASEGRLDSIRDRFPGVQWIPFRAPEGVRVSIPHQRNVGVAAAIGDVIVFTDCGCIPERDWLARLLTPILDDGELVTCGRTGSLGTSVYGSAPTGTPARYLEECPTINLAFRREAFERVGGFDETFQYGSDIDFSWRLRRAGVRLRHVADAVVAHDWGDGRRQARRALAYGRARARLYCKHPGRVPRMLVDDPIVAAYPLFLLGLPLTLRWRWYPLLLAVPLWRNRGHQPARVVADHLCLGVGVLDGLARARRGR